MAIVPPPRMIYTVNLGSLKGEGREIIKPPMFEVRSGHTKELMTADTLRKLNEVLATMDQEQPW